MSRQGHRHSCECDRRLPGEAAFLSLRTPQFFPEDVSDRVEMTGRNCFEWLFPQDVQLAWTPTSLSVEALFGDPLASWLLVFVCLFVFLSGGKGIFLQLCSFPHPC